MLPRALFPTLPTQSATARLVAFPYAGGGTAVYHRWRRDLDSRIDLLPLLLPGRESRVGQAPYARLDDVVRDTADQLSQWSAVPYGFYGHSLGGRMAWEVCRELTRRAQPLPRTLIVSGCAAPHLPPPAQLGGLADEAFLAEVAVRYGELPAAFADDVTLRQLALSNLRADVGLLESAPRAECFPLAIDLLILGGQDDVAVSVADLGAWRQHTTAGFTMKCLPGGHFFAFEGPSQRTVVRLVAERMAGLVDMVERAPRGDSG